MGTSLVRMRPDFAALAEDVLARALAVAGQPAANVAYIATTGLGRYNVPRRDIQITDITCVARGAVHAFPGTRSIVEIGAQTTRAIRVLPSGRVAQFRSNANAHS